jgi:hypothetical protein
MEERERLPYAPYEVREDVLKWALPNPHLWVGLQSYAFLERLLETLATVFPIPEQEGAGDRPPPYYWSVGSNRRSPNYANLYLRDDLSVNVVIPHTPPLDGFAVLVRDPTKPDPAAILEELTLFQHDPSALPGLVSLVGEYLENRKQFDSLAAMMDDLLDDTSAPVQVVTNYSTHDMQTEPQLDLVSVVEEVLGTGRIGPGWVRPKAKP